MVPRNPEDMPPQSPFSLMLGIKVESCTPEEAVCSMLITEVMGNRNGVLHGGALMALADAAAGTSAFINSPAEITNTTVEAKTNFIRPVHVGDTITARSVPIHIGQTTAVLQVTLTRGDGKVVGSTSQTHLFMTWKD